MDMERIRELVTGYAGDRTVQAVAGGVLLLVVVLLVVRGARRRARRSKVDAAAQARQRLLGGLRAFRDDVKRAAEGSAPVFRKIDAETAHASVIGHWRKTLRHRIAVRPVDLGAMKGAARGLRLDATPLSDLEAAWRKMARGIEEYNGGKMDDSPTPIATVRQFEKDLQRIVVLANIALKALGG